ncbi:MAG: hypothetical protein QNJ16_00780 [Rhodobacter sp.]|nr:hypothetical protein [Rhodobacter sp.]
MAKLLDTIADDFAGAKYLANTPVKQGMSVVQVIGVPEGVTDGAERKPLLLR